MTRVPNRKSLRDLLGLGEDRVLDVDWTAPIEGQLSNLVRLERQLPYQWTTDDDEIAEDAIMVGIGGTDTTMLYYGLSYVEPRANIYWCSRVTSQGFFECGFDHGWSVPEALDRAHELRIMMDYPRVVVTLQEFGMWQPEWGKLVEKEGYG